MKIRFTFGFGVRTFEICYSCFNHWLYFTIIPSV